MINKVSARERSATSFEVCSLVTFYVAQFEKEKESKISQQQGR